MSRNIVGKSAIIGGVSDTLGWDRKHTIKALNGKVTIAIRCGPWEVDRPGWLEVDTVSHGGGGGSGEFMWSLTLTDIHTGWTEYAWRERDQTD